MPVDPSIFGPVFDLLTPQAQAAFPTNPTGGFNNSDIQTFFENPNTFFGSGLPTFNGNPAIFEPDAFGQSVFDISGNTLGTINASGVFEPFVPQQPAPPSGGTTTPTPPTDNPVPPQPPLPPPGDTGGGVAPTPDFTTHPALQLFASFIGQDASVAPFFDFDQSGILDNSDQIQLIQNLSAGTSPFFIPDPTGTPGSGLGNVDASQALIDAIVGLNTGGNVGASQSLIDIIGGLNEGGNVGATQGLIDVITGLNTGGDVGATQDLIDVISGLNAGGNIGATQALIDVISGLNTGGQIGASQSLIDVIGGLTAGGNIGATQSLIDVIGGLTSGGEIGATQGLIDVISGLNTGGNIDASQGLLDAISGLTAGGEIGATQSLVDVISGLTAGGEIGATQSLIDVISGLNTGGNIGASQGLIDVISGLNAGGNIGAGQDLLDAITSLQGIDIGFDPSGLILPDIGFNTSNLVIPDIGISPDALAGLTGFGDALNVFGNTNIQGMIESQLDPIVARSNAALQSLEAFLGNADSFSTQVSSDGGFDPSAFAQTTIDALPGSGGGANNAADFTNLDFGTGLTDDRQFLTDTLLNQVLGNTGAQDLIGGDLISALDLANPFARLSEGDNSILDQVVGRINRSADTGRDRLLNQFAVTNKLDQPIFREQLQDFEGSVLDSLANAFTSFGLNEAQAAEPTRRNRLNDLLGFNQGITNNLSSALNQTTGNFVTDIGLQTDQNSASLQNFLNTLAFNNAVGSSQTGFSDQGLGLALNFLGLESGNNAGSQAAGIFGNIINQQQASNAAGDASFNNLINLLTQSG